MKSNKMVLLVVGVILTLSAGFAVDYFASGRGAKPEVSSSPTATALASSSGKATPTQTRASLPAQTTASPAQSVSAKEMFSEFVCPCCGKLIGDCSCGMASERRGFVSGLVSAGKSKLEIYLAYADQYGLDSFASQEVKEEVREYKLANAPKERPQIVLEPQKVDLGNVSSKEGEVATGITLKNTGQKDLIVASLSTSCGCTTASVVNNGQEGPMFGMEGPVSSAGTSWSTTIRPGETAELKVYYDPNFHENARGPILREIYVSSNDPVDPVVKASIELNQVD